MTDFCHSGVLLGRNPAHCCHSSVLVGRNPAHCCHFCVLVGQNLACLCLWISSQLSLPFFYSRLVTFLPPFSSILNTFSGCGFFESDEKQLLEQAWLDKDQQLKEVVEQIRTQGIDAVAKSAQVGSVSACVAQQLSDDPFADLVLVEGALVESAKVSELLASIESLMEQEISFEQVSSFLQKDADAAAYANILIDQQGLEKGLESLQLMAQTGKEYASQDLGGHFQAILLQCKAEAGEG